MHTGLRVHQSSLAAGFAIPHGLTLSAESPAPPLHALYCLYFKGCQQAIGDQYTLAHLFSLGGATFSICPVILLIDYLEHCCFDFGVLCPYRQLSFNPEPGLLPGTALVTDEQLRSPRRRSREAGARHAPKHLSRPLSSRADKFISVPHSCSQSCPVHTQIYPRSCTTFWRRHLTAPLVNSVKFRTR